MLFRLIFVFLYSWVFVPTLALSADSTAELIAALKDRNDNVRYPTTVGYPKCADVIRRKLEEDRQILAMVLGDIRDDIQARFDEVDAGDTGEWYLNLAFQDLSATFLANYSRDQYQYIDFPERPVDHPKYQRHGCFSAETPVYVQGSSATNPTGGVGQRPIFEVAPGEWILSSTVNMFEDERYHEDCWDKVIGVMSGQMLPGDTFHIVRYESEDKSQKGIFTVTDKHRFLTRSNAAEPWNWETAEDLAEGNFLFGKRSYPNTPQFCRVIECSEEKVGGWYTSGCAERPGPKPFYVFNLNTEFTHTYYVGPRDNQVLVHNLK